MNYNRMQLKRDSETFSYIFGLLICILESIVNKLLMDSIGLLLCKTFGPEIGMLICILLNFLMELIDMLKEDGIYNSILEHSMEGFIDFLEHPRIENALFSITETTIWFAIAIIIVILKAHQLNREYDKKALSKKSSM